MVIQTATKPEGPTGEFHGDIQVDDTPPNAKMLASAATLPLLDVNNEKHTFKSLYEGKGRIIVVFIRHFFCGPYKFSTERRGLMRIIMKQNCQEYTKVLSEELSLASLSALPEPTSLIIIGCGSAELIPMYKEQTKTPFPIYADPTRKIYDTLGMTKSLSLGDKQPKYMRQPIYKLSLKAVRQVVLSGRQALSGGDFWQVGGEFVFEPDGTVSWCHRMKNTRDHAELDELRKAIRMGAEAEAVAAVAPGKPIGSRRSLSGAGLVRKLSDRRKSWRNSIGRGRSRNDEANGSVPRSTMEKLKEEPGAPDGDRDAALAKLTQHANENNKTTVTKSVAPNGHMQETAVNGSPTNGLPTGSADSAGNQAPANDSAVEPTASEPAVEAMANGSDKPTANGFFHKQTPFVQNLLNGSIENKAENVDVSAEDTLGKD